MRIADLIFLAYTRHISAQQQAELDRWLAQGRANQELYRYILNRSRIRNLLSEGCRPSQADAWDALRRRIRRHRVRRLTGWCTAACAMMAVVLLGGHLIYNERPDTLDQIAGISIAPISSKAEISYGDSIHESLSGDKYDHNELFGALSETVSAEATITVAKGGQLQLMLDDGTKIWLNSESEFIFPKHFSNTSREVILVRGEAYLEIAKETKRPFIVHNKELDIRVLGTKFNIQNYSDEDCLTTTLVEGSVEVSNSQTPLSPGQQMVFNKQTGYSTVREVDTRDYTAWIDQRFVFKQMPLGMVVRQMTRWYDMKFEFEDERLKNITFSGDVHKYEDGRQLLQIIASTGKASFRQKNGVIVITRPE